MTDRELRVAVVGINYENADGGNRRFEVELCAPGEPIHLHRKPKNKHDPYIRIRFGGDAPTLPVQRERPPTWTDGFYPDPEGSKWGA